MLLYNRQDLQWVNGPHTALQNLHWKCIISAWVLKTRPICICATQRERCFHHRRPFWTQRSDTILIHFSLSLDVTVTLFFWEQNQLVISLKRSFNTERISSASRWWNSPESESEKPAVKWSAEAQTSLIEFNALDWIHPFRLDWRDWLGVERDPRGMSSTIVIYYHLQSHWEIKPVRPWRPPAVPDPADNLKQ